MRFIDCINLIGIVCCLVFGSCNVRGVFYYFEGFVVYVYNRVVVCLDLNIFVVFVNVLVFIIEELFCFEWCLKFFVFIGGCIIWLNKYIVVFVLNFF